MTSDLQVTVIEAKGQVGGRVRSCELGGVKVACSGQWLNGGLNNPVSLMAYQVLAKLCIQSSGKCGSLCT